LTQQIFLDTEFTGFGDPQLISIGMVTIDGKEFYAEVDYELEVCSDFVRQNVIPLLMQVEKCTLVELKALISRWIDEVREPGPVLLCYDSEYDRRMLESIFKNDFPNSAILRNLGASYVNKVKQYDYYVITGQAEHHALHDARALKYAFRRWHRNVR
jgi:putative NIF3 family GTP cyclohydrolase 1 type 2